VLCNLESVLNPRPSSFAKISVNRRHQIHGGIAQSSACKFLPVRIQTKGLFPESRVSYLFHDGFFDFERIARHTFSIRQNFSNSCSGKCKSLTSKMKSKCYSETSVDFERIERHTNFIRQNFPNNRCNKFKSLTPKMKSKYSSETSVVFKLTTSSTTYNSIRYNSSNRCCGNFKSHIFKDECKSVLCKRNRRIR
jgi:hypothetical protein